MSFILDALRKSENARQRQGGPALAEIPFARRRESRPWWIAGVAVLLFINLAVLVVVLTRPRDAVPVAASPAESPAPVASPAPKTPEPPALPLKAPAPVAAVDSPAVAGPSLAEEAGAAIDLDARDDGAAPSATATAAASSVPERSPIVRSLNPGVGVNQGEGPDENLPTLNELTGERATNMPPMHLDIHVYSKNPAERFVFINMRKYTEGATLSEGPVVERIRNDGVVLNQRGFRFILPRQ